MDFSCDDGEERHNDGYDYYHGRNKWFFPLIIPAV
jgi:hypothetical protein